MEHISQQGQPHRHRVGFQFSNDTQHRGARDRTFISFVQIGRPGKMNEVARTFCRKQRIGYSRFGIPMSPPGILLLANVRTRRRGLNASERPTNSSSNDVRLCKQQTGYASFAVGLFASSCNCRVARPQKWMEASRRAPTYASTPFSPRAAARRETYLECCAATKPRFEMNLSLKGAAKLPYDSEPQSGARYVVARGAFKLIEHALRVGRGNADASVRDTNGPSTLHSPWRRPVRFRQTSCILSRSIIG